MKAKYSEIRNPYDGLRFYSALTHGIGIVFSVVGMIFLLNYANGRTAIAAFTVYCVSMIALYTASTVYHSAKVSVRKRLMLRKLDHAMIYLLIAGTYTPLCLVAIKGTVGTALFIATWVFGIAGTVLTLCWINMPRRLTAAIYIVMGWMVVFAVVPVIRTLPVAALILMLAGGIFYTVGAIMYARKWPGRENPRFGCHEVFHVFVLLGSICHYSMMFTLLT